MLRATSKGDSCDHPSAMAYRGTECTSLTMALVIFFLITLDKVMCFVCGRLWG